MSHPSSLYDTPDAAFAQTAVAPRIRELRGSSILAIAAEVRALQAQGRTIHNLTIGDFDPKVFAIPPALTRGITEALEAGHTNYPPAVGVLELRQAIVKLYARDLRLELPLESVIVGSGARPPLYAAFRALVAPGDTVVFPVPSWNINHYTFLADAHPVPIVTTPEAGFMPTAAQLAPHIGQANLIVINSPQNPSGTIIRADALREICEAVVAENKRRQTTGERPVMLIFDAVYWQLTFGASKHHTPLEVCPEVAPYTVMIDAISKCWAATGLRVGWGIAPPAVAQRMGALIGHMGAWAGRAEQIATAALLSDPSRLGSFPSDFLNGVQARLHTLASAFKRMHEAGLPIRSLSPAGAIYLSVQLDLKGRKTDDGTALDTDESMRAWLLHTAGVAVVPFAAFGYPPGSGWMRLSVGSITLQAAQDTAEAIENALRSLPAA